MKTDTADRHWATEWAGIQSGSKWLTPEEFELVAPKLQLTDETAGFVLSSGSKYKSCLLPGATAKECKLDSVVVDLHSGLLNFLKQVLESDYYLYAVFPKNDASGLLERSLLSGAAGFTGAP